MSMAEATTSKPMPVVGQKKFTGGENKTKRKETRQSRKYNEAYASSLWQ